MPWDFFVVHVSAPCYKTATRDFSLWRLRASGCNFFLFILYYVNHSATSVALLKEKHKEMRRNVAVYSNNWNSWFLICLALMYLTDLGVRGIRRYDSSFHSPDMKFHYSVKQVMETFERIGETGRLIYQKYLILDCLFTLFFLIVMLAITNKLITNLSVGNILFVVCVLRAIFDLLENGF